MKRQDVNGIKCKPVKSFNGCKGCAFEAQHKYSGKARCEHMDLCFASARKDGKSVIFKKI